MKAAIIKMSIDYIRWRTINFNHSFNQWLNLSCGAVSVTFEKELTCYINSELQKVDRKTLTQEHSNEVHCINDCAAELPLICT